jgi:hypothetical protein
MRRTLHNYANCWLETNINKQDDVALNGYVFFPCGNNFRKIMNSLNNPEPKIHLLLEMVLQKALGKIICQDTLL